MKHALLFCALSVLFFFLIAAIPVNDKAVREKAAQIHKSILTIDTHCDTPMRLVRGNWDVGVYHDPKERKAGKIDLPRMKQGGLDAEFFAVFLGQGPRTPEDIQEVRKKADDIFNAIKQMCQKYSDTIELALNPDDAYRLEKEGKLACYIGMENGYPVGTDLDYVQRYFDMGARYITLCHTRNNDICDSSTDPKGPEFHGLSDFGEKVVAEMNRLGMIVDISHVSDETFYDVIKITKAPIMASHSDTRALCDNPRNLTDDMIKALAENGGVLQMCLLSGYVKKPKPNPEREAALEELWQKYGKWDEIKSDSVRNIVRKEYYAIREKYPEKRATVKDLVDHIDHVVQLVGIDYVGIGTDFDGGGGLADCNDVSEMGNITLELVRRGYSEDDIRKIWGGNFMRVFRRVQEVAKELNRK
ncbi:membrane dipeptidase [candidate division KSB1 bacterium 4484_87]|nr:MAG: membrane dipeptidase [candidate division KSB1 bacterium 4484_87]